MGKPRSELAPSAPAGLDQATYFAVLPDPAGWVPVKKTGGTVVRLAEPSPYQALAYQALQEAVRLHWAELSRG